MKGDHRSYARAAGTSLLGFGLQLLLGLALLIYAVIGGDNAAFTAALHVLITSFVWLLLAIVFDQHRRERIEAMEAESLDAAAARESSVFGTASDDLRVNAKRLAGMHRLLVPAVSLFIAVLLIAVGVWRYIGMTYQVVNPETKVVTLASAFDQYVGVQFQGWAVSLGLGVAVVGFVFARYASGMSKQPMWSMLRGGAAASVGASLLGLAMALAQFAELLGAVHFGRYLLLAFPVVSIVLGAEIVLNFLLNLYRPRKPGEMPRPPVDSWLLGSIASPDQIAKNIGGAISYQFGVDVTGSWAYRLLSRSVGSLVLVAVGVVWLMTSFTIVGPDETGVMVTLGRRAEADVTPGLSIHAPWPITVVERTRTTQLHQIDLATHRTPEEVTHILWTNDHRIKDETKILVRPTRLSGALGGNGGGDDARALIIVEVPMYYRIKNLKDYEALATPQTREDYLRAIAKREVTRYLSTMDEDEMLGAKRGVASAKLKELVAAALDKAKAGVEVVFVALEGVHPPRDIAPSYEQIVGDQLRAEARIEYARGDAIGRLTAAAGSQGAAEQLAVEVGKLNALRQANRPDTEVQAQEEKINLLVAQAGGSVGSELAAARADRWHSHMSQRGAAEAYAGRLKAFQANKPLYFATAYLDTLERMVKNTRLYIVHDSVTDLRTTLDLKDLTSGGFTFSDPNREKSP